MISNLHFISQETPDITHLESIEKACQAGVSWVQLRVKNKSIEETIAIAKQAKVICDAFDAKLIINDHPLVAKEVEAHGLHLGKEDMPVAEARKIVGGNMIIGATANTIEDIIAHARDGADYIGCGPFGFTRTKAKLSPILGLEGYYHIISEAKKRNINMPIIAIGGIKTEDISSLLQTGVFGIAVSALIAFADQPGIEVNRIKEIFKRKNVIC